MKNKLTILIALFLSNYHFSQEKIPFIDYETTIKAANQSSQNGEYEKALEHISRLNPNDSMYWDAMVNKTYYQLILGRYDEVVALADKGIKEEAIDVHNSFFINKSVAFIRQKKFEEAIKVCDEGLEKFPMNKTLWYNKGVSYEGLNKINDAVKMYMQVILIDPTYRQPYLQLGNICYKQELISQALMCFDLYLLLEPNGQNTFETLNSLNNLIASKNDNTRNNDVNISPDDETFEEIDLILSNRVALNEKYETGNEIKIALTKQNHALLQSLKNYPGNKGFWANKLVPFYQWISDSNYFDVFTYTMSYSIKNETYKKIVEKNSEQISQFHNQAIQKWTDLAQKNSEPWYGKEENLTYYYAKGSLNAIGKLNNGEPEGPWEFYDQEGRLTGKGGFSSNGKRDGDWIWFNSKNEVKETAHYIDGILEGENQYFFEDGKPEILANYKNDQLSGEYSSFNKKGALLQRKYFNNGKLNGSYQTFYDVGEVLPKNKIEYINGDATGQYVEYFPTGDLKYEMLYTNGKANGREVGYHLNGAISHELTNLNGEGNGPYKEYYSNGKLKEEGHITNGYYTGHWQTFYSDGTLESDFEYGDEGKINGVYKYYDRDGKIHYTYEYRKGEIIAYKFFDKNGAIIEENRKKGGEFNYKSYSPYRKITSEGLYDVKGGKIGDWKFYSKHGNLTDEGHYDDNHANGAYKKYYENGNTLSISPYVNDTLNGYYVEYHQNGKMGLQGWYKDNERHGEWRSYTLDGTIKEITFFHKGMLHGEQQYFSAKGIKKGVTIYEFGEIIRDITYDIDGSIINDINYIQDKGTYEIIIYHNNKNPKTKVTFTNGVRHGVYEAYNYAGKINVSGQYLNGNLHGKWVWYTDDSEIESIANFVNGVREGISAYYYENGQLETEYLYENGLVQGEVVSYHENGMIANKSDYVDDDFHGKRETYDPNGKLQLIRYYDHGRLIGYSYLDQNSKELPMKPIKNETGNIVAYFDNGKISREMEYRNGGLVNNFKEYYYSGQLLEEVTYKDGEIDGERNEYFENGSPKTKRQYVLGKLNGITKEYYENGSIKKEETYILDLKNGFSNYYDQSAKPIKEKVYFDDNTISSKTL